MFLLPKFLGNGCWNIDNVVFPDCDLLVVIVVVIKSNHIISCSSSSSFRVLNNRRNDHFTRHEHISPRFEWFSMFLLCFALMPSGIQENIPIFTFLLVRR